MACHTCINALWCLMLLLWALPANTAAQQQHTQTILQQSAMDDPPGQLIFAQVVFRHGARTPLSDMYWPNTQWTNCNQSHPDSVNVSLYDASGGPSPPAIPDADSTAVLPGGCRMGLLTNNGYNMAVDLGRQLRQRYVQQHQLVPPVYRPAVLQAETTASSRTVLTLRGVLSGLYPGTAETVPVACRKPEQEIMIGSNTTCAALGVLTNTFVEQQRAAVAEDANMQQLINEVTSALGLSRGAPFSWGRLRDTLSCMEADGKQLPEKAKQLAPIIDSIATKLKVQASAPTAQACLGSQADCTAAVQLTIGQLLSDIASHMESAAAAPATATATGDPQLEPAPQQQQQQWWQRRWWRQQHATRSSRRLLVRAAAAGAASADLAAVSSAVAPEAGHPKLLLYSAHDTTLMPLLTALGQEQPHWPGFTSSLAFELWQHGSTYYVQVLHDGKPLQFQLAEGISLQDQTSPSDSQASTSTSSRTWVSLVDFMQNVVQKYTISKEAHHVACQLRASLD